MGKRNIRCLIERDRVIMPNGQHYLYPVAKLEISDTPKISQEEIEALDLSLNIVYTESTIIKGWEIFATGRKIHSVKEAKELYRKISIDPSSTVSNHRILFYRFFYSSSKLLAWRGVRSGTSVVQIHERQPNQHVAVFFTRWSWALSSDVRTVSK